MKKQLIQQAFEGLQDKICLGLSKIDGLGIFKEDIWQRNEGGGGKTRVLTHGNLIEKGGVNFSAVYGPTPSKILDALKLPAADFYATGVSIVLHPANPYVPIIHMNIRYFEMSNGTYWFGGGIDVTPHYINKEEAIEFHRSLKKVCDSFNEDYYPEFKNWADNYFYIPHRNETRGIGGIFFDRLSGDNMQETHFNFVMAVGESFLPIYEKLVTHNREKQFSEANKEWQYYRRGRYVEFNLVHDKGTKFGLDTGGRTESILMSLPPMARWEYDFQAEEGSEEEETLKYLRKGIDWLDA